MKILIIAPHPDDEIIGSGGLIANGNNKIHVLFGSVGKCRQLVTGQTTEDVRLKEVKQVAKEAGYTYEIMFIGEEFMQLDSLPIKQLIDKIEDCIEKVKPDMCILPYGGSFDQDHRTIFTASITALRPRPQGVRHFVPRILESEEPHDWGFIAFTPNYYISINASRKVELLKLHKTQYREGVFTRSGENLIRLAKMRGAEVGIAEAEAYKILRWFECPL